MLDSLHRTRVKMCGTTRLADAQAAVSYGVDGLGFIFYAKSPRYIAPESAKKIIDELPPLIDRVGVFVNSTEEEVVAIAAQGLSYLQLHGTESVEYCKRLRKQLPLCRIIKAFRVGEESRPQDFSIYQDVVDAFLLDTYVKGAKGGTGQLFDWSIINTLELKKPIFLAGGLSPENVANAIVEVKPFAIDINSGVESEPGVKDHARLHDLLRSVARITAGSF